MSSSLRRISILMFSAALSATATALAASPFTLYCPDLLAPATHQTVAERVAALDTRGAEIHTRYRTLLNRHPGLRSLLPESEALDLFEDHDITLYRELLDEVLIVLAEDSTAPLKQRIRAIATNFLEKQHFTPNEITARLKQWDEGVPHRWYRILGDRTVEEARALYLGDTPIGSDTVDPQSLVGAYLRETGATHQWIRYPISPDDANTLGPQKLAISVSQQSFESFMKILSTENFVSVIGHANVVHRGTVYPYVGERRELRLPSDGTPFPLVILKTSESERLHRYMERATQYPNWTNCLKHPWRLEGYCATGGYGCCTHWIGNIPIGDLRVDEYLFPGYEGQPPRRQKLVRYPVRNTEEQAMLSIWKVPGHQQFASAIGQEQSNVDGNFASPGWVIQTLLGTTSNARVPVIFHVTSDHRAPFADNIRFSFERPW